ncbi:hypothetical protein Ade02nite_80680 [Paractinoplanes deccanensis]|uniref:Type II toxin-antitoxin system PemK/MazF family toxin n=1 Tax=Paractinoplanes deccanensis TaxID=113561 RepID=A0ABQ3YHF5_9ACTN|nr:hypothetical protein [Actinoplanes deccanensis]GID79427.1 hypothetical protein Ade02nite_80680 [Actinoplanes deccanensis]
MRRGEVWWSALDAEWPVVVLGDGDCGEMRAMQVVAAATAGERRGFVLLSPEEAERERPGGIAGIEVPLGVADGLPRAGVVRVALPYDRRVFCTWQASLGRDDLVERVCVLPAATMERLGLALRLAGIEGGD